MKQPLICHVSEGGREGKEAEADVILGCGQFCHSAAAAMINFPGHCESQQGLL